MAISPEEDERQRQLAESGRYERAGGGTVCDECGRLFYDHQYDEKILGYDDRPFLKVICGGRRVKL